MWCVLYDLCVLAVCFLMYFLYRERLRLHCLPRLLLQWILCDFSDYKIALCLHVVRTLVLTEQENLIWLFGEVFRANGTWVRYFIVLDLVSHGFDANSVL